MIAQHSTLVPSRLSPIDALTEAFRSIVGMVTMHIVIHRNRAGVEVLLVDVTLDSPAALRYLATQVGAPAATVNDGWLSTRLETDGVHLMLGAKV